LALESSGVYVAHAVCRGKRFFVSKATTNRLIPTAPGLYH